MQTEFEDERVTREGTTVGTVDYMAPEQARDSRAASLQSDLYSLGCTFYYLLTGIPPYPGGDITDKLTRHAKSPPPDVRDLRPDVPEALAQVMLRMMAKRTEDRFASFDELIAALDRIPCRSRLTLRQLRSCPWILRIPRSRTTGPAQGGREFSVDPRRSGCRAPSSIPEISLANLPPDLAGDNPASDLRARRGQRARRRRLAQAGRPRFAGPSRNSFRGDHGGAARTGQLCPPHRGSRSVLPSELRSCSW